MLLADCHKSLVRLQILALSLIVKHVGNLTRVDARPATSLVDAHHSDSHRPRVVTDPECQVLVISLHILFHQTVLHDYVQWVQYLFSQLILDKLFQKRSNTLLAHRVFRVLDLSLS